MIDQKSIESKESISAGFNYNKNLHLVHPCDKEEKGGCSDICERKGDEAVCKCEENFKLTDDGKTCEESKA